MATVETSAEAKQDILEIIEYLLGSAGFETSNLYFARFSRLFESLSMHPESGSLQPHLGKGTRMRVVAPYNVYTDYNEAQDIVVILRVLHGSRKITRRMMRPR